MCESIVLICIKIFLKLHHIAPMKSGRHPFIINVTKQDKGKIPNKNKQICECLSTILSCESQILLLQLEASYLVANQVSDLSQQCLQRCKFTNSVLFQSALRWDQCLNGGEIQNHKTLYIDQQIFALLLWNYYCLIIIENLLMDSDNVAIFHLSVSIHIY